MEAPGVAQKLRSELEASRSELRYHVQLEYLVSEIARDLLSTPPEQVDDAINRALKATAQFASANRSSLFLVTEDLDRVTNTHEWCAFEHDSQIAQLQDISFSAFGYHRNQMLEKRVVAISHVDDYPTDAAQERRWIERYGFRSLLFVSLTYNNRLYGALGFYGETDEQIEWSDVFVRFLECVGALFVMALECEKATAAVVHPKQCGPERGE